MSQEDKNLLLKDLCSRVPYHVKCLYRNVEDEIKVGKLNIIQYDEERIVIDTTSLDHKGSDVVGVFPYLYPLSSMTKEQREEFLNIQSEERQNLIMNEVIRHVYGNLTFKIPTIISYKHIDWLNKNHFDYRGLIEKELALDATGLNIY